MVFKTFITKEGFLKRKSDILYGKPIKELNPKMKPYVLSKPQYGYHIFDAIKTMKLLQFAGEIVEKIAKKNGKILFVGTTKKFASIIEKNALKANSFYINSRWLGGMITNWSTIQKQVNQLISLENHHKENNFENLSKKEASIKRKKLAKLRHLFNGIKLMNGRPDLVIFTNQLKEKRAICECLKLGIASICIVDTNGNPDLIPYPIPANGDSLSSIDYILDILAQHILRGKQSKSESSS